MRRQRRPASRSRTKWRLVGGVVILFLSTILFVLWQEFFLANSVEKPEAGGIYTEATVGTVYNFSPFSPNSTTLDKDIQALVFEGLLRYNPATEKHEPALGMLNVLDGGKRYEVTLKEGIKFSNGDLIDVADVLFTYNTILQDARLGHKGLYQAFEYIEINVVDDRTISFRLPEQNVYFESLLTMPIVPQKKLKNLLIEEVADPDLAFNKRPIGAGPFRLKNVIPEDEGLYRIFLERNPYYHGGEALLDQMVIYAYRNPERVMYEHRWPTSFTRVPKAVLDQLEPSLYGEYLRKEYILPRFTGVFFNLDRPIVSLPTFRKGLAMAFDRARIIEAEWKVVNSPFFKSDVQAYDQYVDYSQARIQLRDNGFPYNRDKEVRTQGRDGDPVRVKMITSTEPAVYSRFAQKLVNTWQEELYIEIDLQVLQPVAFQEALEARDYDLILFGQDFSDNFDVLSVWHSSQSGELNLANFTRDDVDFLIDEIRFTGSYQDYQALQDKIDDLLPVLVLGTPNYEFLQSVHLKGALNDWTGIRSLSHRFSQAHLWHFETKMDWKFSDDKWLLIEFLTWLLNGKK